MFLDVNYAFFWSVVDYVNEKNATSPDSTPENPREGNNDFNSIGIFYWSFSWKMMGYKIWGDKYEHQKYRKVKCASGLH